MENKVYGSGQIELDFSSWRDLYKAGRFLKDNDVVISNPSLNGNILKFEYRTEKPEMKEMAKEGI